MKTCFQDAHTSNEDRHKYTCRTKQSQIVPYFHDPDKCLRLVNLLLEGAK